MIHNADAAHRFDVYRRLAMRNRVVAVLRIAVPATGVLALLGLLGQIYISSLIGGFDIGKITVSRDSVAIEAPEYAGLLEDGSAYRVRATEARASLDATDMVQLSEAGVALTRPDGVSMDLDASAARLDMTSRIVTIDGPAHFSDSTGTVGTIEQSRFDWTAQTLQGSGPVEISYADGTHLVGTGITYDAKSSIWTFGRVTLTLPETPGAQEP